MASCESPQQDNAKRECSPLAQLRSDNQKKLLDTVDKLRSIGLSAELQVPQLIVCGDTSSGKSSVLEAISGVRFPAKDELCTRFASELVLRKEDYFRFEVSINPAKTRSQEEQNYLMSFTPSADCTNVHDFPGVIEEATRHMNHLKPEGDFFEDTLRAKVFGPALPLLTLVDLPGLIHASKEKKDIGTVKKIVKSYMAQPSSIILAVVTANNNFANQEVLQLVRAHDPNLERTLGIMTKPDLAKPGSKSEAQAIRCVKTEWNGPSQFGWHVLMNRDSESVDASHESRDAKEAEYLSTSNWSSVPEEDRGASSLRTKLSEILLKAICGNLPSIIKDIDGKISCCEGAAKQLGEPMTSELQKKHQLAKVSEKLHSLVRDATEGNYDSSEFFDQKSEDPTNPRRVRACLRNYLKRFAEDMRNKGRRFSLASDEQSATVFSLDFASPQDFVSEETELISFENLQRSLERHMTHNLGLGPPDKLPPVMYTSILRFQCARWEQIAVEYARGCWLRAKDFFTQALIATAPTHVATAVKRHLVEKHFNKAETKLTEKVKELLKPYKSRSYFTLNNYKNGTGCSISPQHSDGKNLILQERSETDEVFDWLFPVYEIALSTFIDNFSTLAIEPCLVEDLSTLFTSSDVIAMDSEVVDKLTAEPASIVRLRSDNDEQLGILRAALKTFNQHMDGLDMSWTSELASEPVTERKSTPSGTQIDEAEAHMRLSARTGTTDTLVDQLKTLNVSPPSPQGASISEPPGTAKKVKSSLLNLDPNTMTPPKTPRRGSESSDYLAAAADDRPHSAMSSQGGKRRTRVIPSAFNGSPGRSPSPLATYRDPTPPVLDEPSSEEL